MTRTGGYGIAPLKTTAQVRGPIDTLIVAGGWGVYDAVEDAGLVRWIRSAARRSRRVTSVCSGSFLLAGAGLLEGSAPPPTGPPAQSWRGATPRSTSTRTRSSSTTATSGPRPESPRAWTSRWRWSRRTSAERSRWRSRAGWCCSCSAPAARPSSAPTCSPSSPSAMPCASSRAGSPTTWTATCGSRSLAERAAMSPRNFARAFRREIGMTPAAYVTELRVERARQRLESGAEPIDQVADPLRLRHPRDHAPRLRPSSGRSPRRVPQPLPHPDPQLTQEEPTMQVAYLLYDRFTALDITGPHEVLNSVPDVESIFVAETGGAGPQRVGHPLAGRRRLARRGHRAPTSSSSPAASAPARCSSTSRCSTGSGAVHETQRVHDLGLHRHPAARGRRPARRHARDHPFARPRPARRARREAGSRPGGRARQDPHRRRRLLGHRHGPAPGPDQVRRRGRPGGPARHRVRPPAPARRRLAREGPEGDRGPGHGRSSRRRTPSSPKQPAA